MTKALFLDLDGTLLDDQKNITAGNRRAIEDMLAAGHKCIITTGRPLFSALIQAHRLGLDAPGCYVIAYNGGQIYDFAAGRKVFESLVPLPLAEKLFAEAERRGLHIQAYDDDAVVVEPRCDDETVRRYTSLNLSHFRVVDRIGNLGCDPGKVLLADYDSRAGTEPYRQWAVAQPQFAGLDIFFSCFEYLEIVNKGISKGAALRQLAEVLGIPIENTVSAGDAPNDTPMIQAAGVGCAMKNADEDVKAAADYVTERDNNHDGIEEIIRKFIL